jgi:hypothetical protein
VTNGMADKESRCYGRWGHSKARLPLLCREGTVKILQKISLPRKPGLNTQKTT